MKVIVTHLNRGEKPPVHYPGVIESDHVSAIRVEEEGYFMVFLLSGQQLHILNEKEVYKQLVQTYA